jgi:hypothetical protein
MKSRCDKSELTSKVTVVSSCGWQTGTWQSAEWRCVILVNRWTCFQSSMEYSLSGEDWDLNLQQSLFWLKAATLRLSWYRQTKCCQSNICNFKIVCTKNTDCNSQSNHVGWGIRISWHRRKDIRYHQLWVMRCFPCSWPSPVTGSFSTRCSLLKPWPHYSAPAWRPWPSRDVCSK